MTRRFRLSDEQWERIEPLAGLVARLNVDLKTAEDTLAHSSNFAEG